jgi:hypothetical protein
MSWSAIWRASQVKCAMSALGIGMVAACGVTEPEEEVSAPSSKSAAPESRDPTALATTCSIISSQTGPVTCVGSVRTYTLSHNLSNPTVRWSVVSGDMSILGATTGAQVSVQFHSSFVNGQLLAELDAPPFIGVDCGVVEPITSECMSPTTSSRLRLSTATFAPAPRQTSSRRSRLRAPLAIAGPSAPAVPGCGSIPTGGAPRWESSRPGPTPSAYAPPTATA